MAVASAAVLGVQLWCFIAMAPVAQGSRVTARSLSEATLAAVDVRQRAAKDGSGRTLAEGRTHAAAEGRAHAAAEGRAHAAAEGRARTAAEGQTHAAASSRRAEAASVGKRSAAELQGHSLSTRSEGSDSGSAENAVQMLVQKLIQQSAASSDQDKCWIEDGDRMGCKADCKCGFLEQCYPKFVAEVGTDKSHRHQTNVGVCGTAMPVLIFLSGALFLSLLSCIVMARMYFQWRESQILEGDESMDRPKTVMMPSSVTGVPAPSLREKADSVPHTGVAWPEAEAVSG